MAGNAKFDQWLDASGNVRSTVLQRVLVTTGFSPQTITSTQPYPINGMVATITPTQTNSIILIKASISGNWVFTSELTVKRNNQYITPQIGSRYVYFGDNYYLGFENASYIMYIPTATSETFNERSLPLPFMHADRPNSNMPQTYQLYTHSYNGGNAGAYSTMINQRAVNDMLGNSFMELIEIAQ